MDLTRDELKNILFEFADRLVGDFDDEEELDDFLDGLEEEGVLIFEEEVEEDDE